MSNGDLPICSERSCTSCSFHDQCMDAYGVGCHIAVGRCMVDGETWHVDGSVEKGDGSAMAPFPNINQALAHIDPEQEGTIILHEFMINGMEGNYDEAISIRDGKTVAILANEFERPKITPSSNNDLVRATDTTTFFYLQGVRVQDPNNTGIHITSGATTTLDQCEIITNDNYGLISTGGSSLVMRNSTIWSNYNLATRSTVRIANSASADISYSTIINAHSNSDTTDISCHNALETSIRNSIFISSNNEPGSFGCPNASITNSAGTGIPPNNGNFIIDNYGNPPFDDEHITELFLNPTGPSLEEIDLRLSARGATMLSNIAIRQQADLPFDIDGDPRPPVGSPDYPGADVP
ncbi:MAG: right-handed parallel beta-helix repeat-containing protein [Myxococcota bacterium]